MVDIHPFRPFRQYTSFYPYYLPSYYSNYYPRSYDRYYQPMTYFKVAPGSPIKATAWVGGSSRRFLWFLLFAAIIIALLRARK